MKKKKIISLLLLIGWMFFIFIMSSYTGNDSSNQSNIVVMFISRLFNIDNLSLLSIIIRKTAHVLEFLILSILFCNVLYLYNINVYFSIIFSFIYAIFDEIHQLFIIGRTGQALDVIIDSFGILIGFIIYRLIKKKIKHY